MVVGDTLFSLGCGRVMEGTMPMMHETVMRLANLPGETLVYCGHEYTEANAKFALIVDPENALLGERIQEVAALRARGAFTLPTTIAREREANPFLRAADPQLQKALGLEDADPVEVFTILRERKNRFQALALNPELTLRSQISIGIEPSGLSGNAPVQLRYFAVPPRKAAVKGEAGPDPATERRQETASEPASLPAVQPPVHPAAPADAARERKSPPADPAASAAPARGAPDPRAILDSIGQTVYDWNLESDQIVWGPNADSVFGFRNISAFATGRGYAECLSHESESSPYEAIARSTAADDGMGVPFQICYGIIAPDSPARRDHMGRGHRTLVRRAERPPGARPRSDPRHHRPLPAGPAPRPHVAVRHADRRVEPREPAGADGPFLRRRRQAQTILRRPADRPRQSVHAQPHLWLRRRRSGDRRSRQTAAKPIAASAISSPATPATNSPSFCKIATATELNAAAERLIEVVAATPFETSAGPVPVSLRIGGAVAPRNGRSAHVLFQHAEEALDLARQPGAARFVLYEPSLAREDLRMRALKISDEIVSALNEGRILIALQPLVRAATGETELYEALMRLRRPDGSLVAPATILPTAEKSGLIQMIDQRVLELALKRLAEQPEMRLAVNVSGQTLHEPDFFSRLRVLLEPDPELARRLTVELTETCAIEDVEATVKAVSSLKQLGVKVAMDDFGSGHTSFKNLRRFNFDMVKIDGAFVQNMSRSDDDRFFVRTLIDLARHVGIPVVAEWVEDQDAADLLRDWGVDYLQGDFFAAAAVPASRPPAD